MSEYLQKVIYLTQGDYNTLASGTENSPQSITKNGITLTNLNDNYLYVTDGKISDVDINGIISVSHGGTGVDSLLNGQVLIGNGTDPISTIAKTSINTPNTLVERDTNGDFSARNITMAQGNIGNMTLSGTKIIALTAIDTTGGSGLLAYKPSNWTGVSSSQWGVGTINAQGVIRSSDTDLLHSRSGTNSVILDVGNYKTYTYALDGSNTGTTLKIFTQTSAYTNQIQFMNNTTKKGSVGCDNNGAMCIYGASKIALRPVLDAATDGVEITTSAMIPTKNNTMALGGTNNKWTTVYAATFSGNATSADSAKWLMNRGTNVTIADSAWNHGQTGAGGTNTSGGTVWKQKWTQSGLTYTPSGGSATTLSDSGDIVLWLSQNTESNNLWVNMAIDGYIYSLSGFKGNLIGNANTASAVGITTHTNTTNGNKAYYLPFLTATSGNLSPHAHSAIYLYETVSSGAISKYDFCFGASTIQGSITLWDGSSHYGNISTTNLSGNRTYTLPNANGTIALTSSDITGNAATATTASSLASITSTDAATSSATWRRLWISYNNNTTGRPAYTDNLVYQTSTNTLKAPHLLIEHASGSQGEMHITYDSTIDYWWGIGTDNVNHGLYDNKASGGAKWILSAGSDNVWTFVGNVTGDVSGSSGSCTGNAATATSSKVLANQKGTYGTATTTNNRVTDTNIAHVNNGGVTHFKIGTATNGPAGGGNILHFYWDTSSAWNSQLYVPHSSTNSMAYRASSSAGTWDSWRTLLDSSNYTDYAVTLTGTNASGTWGISISGNAANASKVSAKLATITKTYLLGTATTITATAANVDITGDTGVYLTTTAGELSAARHSWNVSGTEKAYTVYNTIDNSIDFIFI